LPLPGNPIIKIFKTPSKICRYGHVTYYLIKHNIDTVKKAQEPGATALARAAQPISHRLDGYWHGLRLQKTEVPALHLLIDDKAEGILKNSSSV
jgi:hypothetical protein